MAEQLLKRKCVNCQHEWVVRKVEAVLCPNCNLPYDKKGRGQGYRKGQKGSWRGVSNL